MCTGTLSWYKQSKWPRGGGACRRLSGCDMCGYRDPGSTTSSYERVPRVPGTRGSESRKIATFRVLSLSCYA
eukprot:382873-Rhodomonas_salina.1